MADRIREPGAIPSGLRGPPRKPRQSGNALWVGNLPPATQILDLKDHFSRDATKDIQSVFLISKSNCAFVNYKTDAAMIAAMTRFHEADFQGARLICRPRQSVSGGSVAAIIPQFHSARNARLPAQSALQAIARNRQLAAEALATAGDTPGIAVSTPAPDPNRYFVLKSLTVEDLVLSVSTGIWATQAHNEDALNQALKVGKDKVFLCCADIQDQPECISNIFGQ